MLTVTYFVIVIDKFNGKQKMVTSAGDLVMDDTKK